jgi:hypothetical protein
LQGPAEPGTMNRVPLFLRGGRQAPVGVGVQFADGDKIAAGAGSLSSSIIFYILVNLVERCSRRHRNNVTVCGRTVLAQRKNFK